MIAAVQDLGLTSGLKLCLDASDINSYSGSGQKWLDTSGNAYDFFRGTTSSSQSSDPTFNGTAGGQSSSEYWSFDGGDFFTYDSPNETWMQNLHKNSAIWAFAGYLYVASLPGTAAILFGDGEGNASLIGVSVLVRTDGTLRLIVVNGNGGGGALVITTTATVNTNAWNFVAGQVSEAAGTGFLQINATQEDKTTTYSNPSSSSASRTFEIGRDGTGSTAGPLPSGYRLASVVMWEGTVPSATQEENLRLITKGKFGL
jgi:hypothetical protein